MADVSILEQAGLAAAEQLINATLRLDPATLRRMTELEGSSLRVECLRPHVSLCIIPGHDGLQLMGGSAGTADVTVTGSAAALLRLAREPGNRSALFSPEISVSGDTELAQAVSAIFEDLEIDWEALVARYTGDVAAHELGRVARQFLGLVRNTVDTLRLDVGEFLQEESRALPGRAEQELFFSAVDQLRADTERLEARIMRLRKPAGAAAAAPEPGGD